MRKAVLVGCGGISNAWLSALEHFSDVQIVALCDLDVSRTAAVAEKWGLKDTLRGDDLEGLIEESGADTVFDCTVPSAHKSVTLTALSNGCDVLGEKPMAENLEDAGAMVAKAEETGNTYAVIQNRRYNPSIIRFRDAIAGANAGRLTTLNADFYVGAHFDGFRAEMEHVLLLDMAIHSFDQARFISGCDPISVYACDWNPKGSWYRHGASAAAIFEMSGGLIFNYRGSWCAEGLNTSWECAWRGVAETGSCYWDGLDEVRGERESGKAGLLRKTRSIDVPPAVELGARGHAGVIREFLDSLAAGTKPQTDCRDNVKSLAMVLAAIESAETGRRAEIPV